MLHAEGMEFALRRCFPIGGSYAGARTFKLGLSSINCGGHPVYPSTGPPTYDESTTYADIVVGASMEGGAYDDTHRSILGYSRQATSLIVSHEAKGGRVETSVASFTNAIPWQKLGSWQPGGYEPPDWRDSREWEPEHRYPWQVPWWKTDYWGDAGLAGALSDMLTDNPRRGATFPVGLVFLCTESPDALIGSALLRRCLEIQPGAALFAPYVGRVHPVRESGPRITSTFAEWLARRTFDGTHSPPKGDYIVALATNPAGSLDEDSVAGDVAELDDQASEGYSRQTCTAWSLGPTDNHASCSVDPFENTSADQGWETVTYACVMCPLETPDVDVLCWTEELATPLALQPTDRLTFPSGLTIGLLNP